MDELKKVVLQAGGYELMKRPSKAELVWDYLERNGVHAEISAIWDEQPVPEAIKQRLRSITKMVL